MVKQRIEFYELFNRVFELKRLQGLKFEFTFMLIELKKKIKPKLDESDEKKKALMQEMKNLKIQHCTKKADGTADVIYTKEGKVIHKGIALGECPDYDKRMEEIDNRITEIDKEELDIDIDDIKKIKKAQCPKDEMTGDDWEVLEPWISDFHD